MGFIFWVLTELQQKHISLISRWEPNEKEFLKVCFNDIEDEEQKSKIFLDSDLYL